MRSMLIAGNWKMHKTASEAQALLVGLLQANPDLSGVDVAVFPPAVYLELTQRVLRDSPIRYGGQNMSWAEQGAFTGEISAAMLKDLGAHMVLLGHSERRHVFGETDAQIRQKLDRALASDLIPVVCLGETLDEREAGRTEAVVLGQLEAALQGLDSNTIQKMILAYEPVWAIGTGKTATPDQAQDVHRTIRGWIEVQYDKQTADALRILYGGSVKPDNAEGLLTQPDIDGALVGGACLKVDDFTAIIQAAPAM